MYRRTALAALGLGILALAGGPATRGQDRAPAGGAHHAHGPHATCAHACFACAQECESCQHHCVRLVADGKKDHVRTMRLCNDCGEVCATAGKVVSREGPLSVTICESCAKACDVCGASCKKFDDDDHMKRCAKACEDCAKACRDMIKHAGHKTEGTR